MVTPASARSRRAPGRLFGCVFAVVALLAQASLITAEPAPLATVAGFDLSRFLGPWYQIALIPNRFQAFCVGDTTAHYARDPRGRIAVINRCRDADGAIQSATGVARVNREYANPARLQVRFAPAWLSWLGAVWGDYWVLDVDDDYHSMMVGSPDREYLWILARAPSLSAQRYSELIDRARSAGFDVTRIQAEPGIDVGR